MATTPRPYLWQSLQLRASDVDGTAGLAHYFTEEAQSLYLKNDGLDTKLLEVDDGHWQSLTEGTEEEVSNDEYRQISFHHPSMGTLYGTGIIGDILYFLRYDYAKDIGHIISDARYTMQVDNPITQLNMDVKNFDSDAFTKKTTLFVPGAKMELGLVLGNSPVYKMGELFIDEVDFQYARASVSVSGRNVIGLVLNDETINDTGKRTDTISNLCAWVLESFGLYDYVIETNNTVITLEYAPSTTGMSMLQTICDKASGYTTGTDWQIEETADGIIVIGYNAFRANYLPKSVYKFDGWTELFRRSSTKVIDGAYSKVYVAGRDSNNHDLTPVIQNVTTWSYWAVGSKKTYFAPMIENTTQAELERYAQVLAKQLKRTGVNENYHSPIRPQLLVGDYAVVEEYEEETDIGIITQVTHTFGENGFFTDFVADSGGDKQTLLQLNDDSEEAVYTSSRRNNGDNRKKRLMDFIQSTAKQVVRTSGSGNSGTTGAVIDVLVDGSSVVADQVASISLAGKQDKLTAGEHIAINGAVISSDIEPFSIVDGKVNITWEE